MDGSSKKCARDDQSIGDIEAHTGDGESVGQAPGEPDLPVAGQSISAKQQGQGHQKHGRKLETDGGSQRPESGEDQQIKSDIEVAAYRRCQSHLGRSLLVSCHLDRGIVRIFRGKVKGTEDSSRLQLLALGSWLLAKTTLC